MKRPATPTPPVRTPDSYRILPDGCTGCKWILRTDLHATGGMGWARTARNPDCPAAHPDSEVAS